MSKHSAFGRGARPLKCRECGALRSEGADISFRGLCMPCAHERATDAADQVRAREGPHYDEYVRGIRAYVRSLDAR